MKDLIASLSPLERRILPHLKSGATVREIAEAAGVEHVEVMRACQFLSNKEAVTIAQEASDAYTRTELGEAVRKEGFPEERFLKALDKPKALAQLGKDTGLDRDEVNVSIGLLKKAGAIALGKEVKKTGDVDFATKHASLEKPGTGEHVEELTKRGLLEKTVRTAYRITLTPTGKKLQGADLGEAFDERLTQNMLKDGSWKDATFRHYDVTAPVPAATYGRKHFVNEAVAHIKQVWIEMGFSEMTGTITQTAFWDLDTLFVPQDHPARDMQDTFYIPTKGTLPSWWKDIKDVHEKGGGTGSKGWGGTYSEEEAQRVLLRTHTTVLSAQALKALTMKDLPAKLFSVNKIFRNETLDWKHLFDLHQVEGIVVGKGLTLADLIGLQKEFYAKMGYTDIRFRPSYYPYTYCSADVEVFHPVKKQWMELGGMGVFRPEVVKPLLGEDVTVLAWGLGMERVIMSYYDITDIRELYANDLAQLRSIKHYVPGD